MMMVQATQLPEEPRGRATSTASALAAREGGEPRSRAMSSADADGDVRLTRRHGTRTKRRSPSKPVESER